jgi:rubrerythrin
MLDEVTLRKSIELAVTTEKLGAGFYKTLAEKFRDENELNELFSTLAKDEVVAHEREFRSLLDRIPRDEKVGQPDERYRYLAATAVSEFFMGEKGAFRDTGKIKTRDDALGRAFAFEKATLLYYHAIRDILGENQILHAIIKAEKSHVVSVMKYLITGAKMRGLSDTW